MPRSPLYVMYALAILAALGAAEWRGWSPFRPDEVKNVPLTVRNNPGSYRPHYSYSGSGYRRGK
jgi:hypothetical protein